MSIETYGNDASFHKVLKVELVEGGLDGNIRVVIHQLVETERDDYNFEPYNGRFIMKHAVELFPAGDNIEATRDGRPV